MLRRTRPSAALASAVVLACLALTACSSDDPGKASAPEGRLGMAEDAQGVDALAEAVAMVKVDREPPLVLFRNDRAITERLGLLDRSAGDVESQEVHFREALRSVPATDTAARLRDDLSGALLPMTAQDAGFSALDVRWSMTLQSSDAAGDSTDSVRVYRLVDGVDMGVVGDRLQGVGFVRADGPGDGWTTYTFEGTLGEAVDPLSGLVGETYPSDFFPEVRTHDAQRLLVLGDSALLDATQTTETVLSRFLPEDSAAVEYFALRSAAHTYCFTPVDVTSSNRGTPELVNAWAKRPPLQEIGWPLVSTLSRVPGDDVVLRQYFSAGDPARILRARRDLFTGAARTDASLTGVLLPKDGNDSPYEAGWTMSWPAGALEIRHNKTDPAAATETFDAGAVGFEVCLPSG